MSDFVQQHAAHWSDEKNLKPACIVHKLYHQWICAPEQTLIVPAPCWRQWTDRPEPTPPLESEFLRRCIRAGTAQQNKKLRERAKCIIVEKWLEPQR
jgi:hypothetical protein